MFRMGSKRLDTFNDCFYHRVSVRITCWHCKRERLIQNGFDSLFREKGIAMNMHVTLINTKVKCGNCGAKRPRVQLLMPD